MSLLPVVSTGARVASLVTTGLVAGSVFGIWRGYDSGHYSAATFVEVQQGAIEGLNSLLPMLGLVATVLAVILAVVARRDRQQFALLLVVAVLLAAAGLITRFGNQPINEIVMGWTVDTLPPDWEALRDNWRNLHLLRTVASIAAFVALSVALVTGGAPAGRSGQN